MTTRKLPNIEAFDGAPSGIDWDAPIAAREAWTPVKALADNERTINMYEEIGDRGEGRGVTVGLVRGALRRMGPGDITVNINSPGGDYFSGLAIYNLLREHPGKVTTNVIGVAASAASVIAMASDTLRVGKAAFLMIHNAQAVAMGNRHELAKVIGILAQFDEAMALVYADRSGMPVVKITAMMDAVTHFTGEQAVSNGMADALLESDEVAAADESAAVTALRRTDIGLAKAGYSRQERRALMSSLKEGGTPRAALTVMPSADDLQVATHLQQLLATLKA